MSFEGAENFRSVSGTVCVSELLVLVCICRRPGLLPFYIEGQHKVDKMRFVKTASRMYLLVMIRGILLGLQRYIP